MRVIEQQMQRHKRCQSALVTAVQGVCQGQSPQLTQLTHKNISKGMQSSARADKCLLD